MGQVLSEPITAKEITVCQSPDYSVAACSMQGWRVSMEDSHVHLLGAPQDEKAAFFGVFDGHGGARVAQYAGMHLHKRIIGNEPYLKGDFRTAIQSGFLQMDEDLKQDEETKEQMSGTTAVVVLIKDGKIFCGNAGDSRAVLSQQGKSVPLSFDHKPNDPDEMKRILAAGGWVDACRVNGNLALSRALGDFVFKNNDGLGPEDQIVTAFPDIVEVPITDEHEFILIACDGIWDVLTSEQAIAFCRQRLSEGRAPEQICEELVDRCLSPDCELSGIGCDNMTVVLVCLMQGLSKEDYTERLKRKSLSNDDMHLQNMFRNLKFDQNFTKYTDFFVVKDESNNDNDSDKPVFFGEEVSPAHVAVIEGDKPFDQFTTPSESPNNEPTHDDSDNDPPPTNFEVIVPTKQDPPEFSKSDIEKW